jgi:hypothetical protein
MMELIIKGYFVISLVIFLYTVLSDYRTYKVHGKLSDKLPITSFKTQRFIAIFSVCWGPLLVLYLVSLVMHVGSTGDE